MTTPTASGAETTLSAADLKARAIQRRAVEAVMLDGVIPYDVRYFESLNRIVQAEPWLERDGP